MSHNRVILPDFRIGPGSPKRFLCRDLNSIPGRLDAKRKLKHELMRMWRQFNPMIHCQVPELLSEEDDAVAAIGRPALTAAWDSLKGLRLTEEECHGDVDEVNYVILDTANDMEPVAAWQWYNITFIGPTSLRMRPWPIIPLDFPVPLATVVGWLVDALEIFLRHPGIQIGARTYTVDVIRTFTFFHPQFPTPRDAQLRAWAAEIDARGADARNPLTVNVVATPWGGEDRILTWEP